MITTADGTQVPFNADRINHSIERACAGLTDPISKVTKVASETELTLYNGITTDELDEATINAAVQNVSSDIDYDKIATRLLLKTVYRRVLGECNWDNHQEIAKRHQEHFALYIKEGVRAGMFDERMVENFDLEALAQALDLSRDDRFQYAGLSGLLDRYGIKNSDHKAQETPQYFFMRVAMGLSLNEADSTDWAIRFYQKLSRHEYIGGGSTNVNAGTKGAALSNCFLIQMEDDMAHIAKSVADVMKISKATGGIGVSVTKLRATGSTLRASNTVSSGPTTFAKIMDVAIRAIQRGGKKKGALAFYMENWHLDFPEFIDWKHNAGDDHMRMRTANSAAYLSDEFMKRVENDEMWYMFDPKETSDLIELYGTDFSKRYAEYIEMAEAGELKMFKKVPAQEQYRQILVALQTTSHPWITWKDAINLRALNNNTGTIHMSNLCTEICLPQDANNIAVCNLASLNLSQHIREKEVLWGKLEETVRIAIRHLDNLVDINVLPIDEAKNSDVNNRAVGLGVMGFADAIEKLGMAYDSPHAWDFADRIFEFISYMAIDESANLARERGSYANFEGSLWSQGKVPIDTLETVEASREQELLVPKESKHKGLNWDLLRSKVAKGMRNATLMAVAPNANIGLLAGTTPGIDARFAQVFSRNKISGKYLDINHNLVKDLKNLGIWEEVREEIIQNHGDLSEIDAIPDHLKDIYKTSFTTSPYAYVNVAARAQKWVDQALSRNMYLKSRDIDEMMKVYSMAWKLGVKTTYYCHMQPRHSAEQSTIKVNKAASLLGGSKGFGALKKREAVPETAEKQPIPAFEAAKPLEVEDTKPEVPEPVVVAQERPQVEIPKEPLQSKGGFAAVKTAQAAAPIAATTIEREAPMQSIGSVIEERNAIPQEPIQERPVMQHGFRQVPQQKPEATQDQTAKTCPIDPAEREQCDSCQ